MTTIKLFSCPRCGQLLAMTDEEGARICSGCNEEITWLGASK